MGFVHIRAFKEMVNKDMWEKSSAIRDTKGRWWGRCKSLTSGGAKRENDSEEGSRGC